MKGVTVATNKQQRRLSPEDLQKGNRGTAKGVIPNYDTHDETIQHRMIRHQKTQVHLCSMQAQQGHSTETLRLNSAERQREMKKKKRKEKTPLAVSREKQV